MYASERARNFQNYIHLPMAMLTITHNSAPLPTLCLLYFTVPVRDTNLHLGT